MNNFMHKSRDCLLSPQASIQYFSSHEYGNRPYNRGLKNKISGQSPGDIYAKVLMEKLLLVFTLTPSKTKIKTVQQIEHYRIWQTNWSKYARTPAKIQVGAIFHNFMLDIKRNVPTNAPLSLVSRFASVFWLKKLKIKIDASVVSLLKVALSVEADKVTNT